MLHAAPTEHPVTCWVVPHKPLSLTRFELMNHGRASEERQRSAEFVISREDI